MALRLPTAARNAACDAIVDLVDAGGAGSVEVRTGLQPASANDAATGTLLATFTLPTPAFGASATGAATLDTTPVITATGVADGTAGWFRVLSGGAATVFDGGVSATGGGGQLELSTLAVTIGLAMEITAGTVTMPAV